MDDVDAILQAQIAHAAHCCVVCLVEHLNRIHPPGARRHSQLRQDGIAPGPDIHHHFPRRQSMKRGLIVLLASVVVR